MGPACRAAGCSQATWVKKKKKYNYGEEGLGRVIYSQFGLRHGAFSGMGIWDSDYSFGALS